MPGEFDYFVILAGMRTGSNLLEESLNGFADITCYGEVFNPAFAGHAHQDTLFGKTPQEIGDDPAGMIAMMREKTDGIAGFRLFADHNDKALSLVLDDPRCAKIVLRRNPVESFVSLQIVRQTNQWRLNDLKQSKKAVTRYDPAAFADYHARNAEFYGAIRARLQKSGQAAFEIGYAELTDDAIIEGAARFVGSRAPQPETKARTKKQNPETLAEKVSNYGEMIADLAKLDVLGLFDDPSFEPERGANVQAFVASDKAGLLFQPIKGCLEQEIEAWLSDVSNGASVTGFSQKDLRKWKRQHPGHRAFTVVRHPVERAFDALVTHFLTEGDAHFAGIANTLRNAYEVDLPSPAPLEDIPAAKLKQLFLGFLAFVKGNLAGQTSVRVDGAWATQAACLAGMAPIALPDRVIREADIVTELPELCRAAGRNGITPPPMVLPSSALLNIYDDSVEKAVRAAYQRDYMMFGFGPLRD